jgi:murein DD-endopeptidase MepM/ murein hydrolase activator NlpD
VQGRIIASFGAREGGLHNDGINIAARDGAAVRAAENGVVAYTGNQLQGFGNLVLIKHSDGWMSAYAHSSEVLVKRGDVVRRGQVIARVGRTGSVSAPQLHFELRKGERAVDPRRYLVGVASLRPPGRLNSLNSMAFRVVRPGPG